MLSNKNFVVFDLYILSFKTSKFICWFLKSFIQKISYHLCFFVFCDTRSAVFCI